MYTIELVWNREFHYCVYGKRYPDIEVAIKAAKEILYSGDGARVKKCRVLNKKGEVVWNG